MRRTLRDLADARKELLEIQQEFGRLQRRIDAVRDCVTDSLTRIFGEERPAIPALAEEEFIEKLAGRVAMRLGTQPATPKQIGNRYVREREAAVFLGVSVKTLRAWRGRVSGDHPPVTRVGGMVMYSMKALEAYMEARTIGNRD
jgi:hypothetical protein